jgi:hypothetical protein
VGLRYLIRLLDVDTRTILGHRRGDGAERADIAARVNNIPGAANICREVALANRVNLGKTCRAGGAAEIGREVADALAGTRNKRIVTRKNLVAATRVVGDRERDIANVIAIRALLSVPANACTLLPCATARLRVPHPDRHWNPGKVPALRDRVRAARVGQAEVAVLRRPGRPINPLGVDDPKRRVDLVRLGGDRVDRFAVL